MTIILMPFLALLAGVGSLFSDPNKPNRKWITRGLIIALVATFTLSIWQSYEAQSEAQIQDVKQKDEIKWSKDKISGLISSLENFEKSTNKNFDETKDSIEKLAVSLRSLGWGEENVNRVVQSYTAKESRKPFINEELNALRASTTLQYFPKEVDENIVTTNLKELGFNLTSGNPTQQLSTNAIWFGTDVPIDQVKIVALTLIEAGVDIQTIKPFISSAGSKKNKIQVGSDPDYVKNRPLRVTEIESKTKFTRR